MLNPPYDGRNACTRRIRKGVVTLRRSGDKHLTPSCLHGFSTFISSEVSPGTRLLNACTSLHEIKGIMHGAGFRTIFDLSIHVNSYTINVGYIGQRTRVYSIPIPRKLY